MPESDVSFTFDTNQFENGIKTLNKGMKGMQTTAMTVAKGVAAGMVVATAAIGVFKLGIKGARKLLNEMLSGMPEIGTAFKIAKDIFFRNFLYPIRKAIMPFLQRMLDWVRDHRVMFVKWGQVVVGIFKTMLKIGRKVIDMFKRIWQGAARILSNLFGVEIKRVGDLMNIMAFKISATIQFLAILLRTLFKTIGKIAEKIAEFGIQAVKDFFEGFIEGAPGAQEAVQNVLKSLKELFQTLIDINVESGTFTKIFKSIGAVTGLAFVLTMLEIERAVKLTTFSILGFTKAVELSIEAMKLGEKRDPFKIKALGQEVKDIAAEEKKWYRDWWRRRIEAWKETGKTFGEIWKERPPGAMEEGVQNITVEPMVQEKLSKKEGKALKNDVVINTININVPEGTTEIQSRKILEGFFSGLREGWNKEQETLGY